MVRVALLQLAVNSSESVAERVTRALELTRQALAESDIAVLPELWPTGAFDLDLGLANAQPIDGELPTTLSELAASTGKWLHGGSFVESADGNYFNTSLIFAPDGSLTATYRKIHLFGFDTGEAAQLTAGDRTVVVDTVLGRTGLATCYDLRFPELFRRLLDQGATTTIVTSGWPTKRLKSWQTFTSARAAEDQMWLIGCNETGTHAGIELAGHSVVCDPLGEQVAALGSQEAVRYVTIDPDQPRRVRSDFPVLRDRQDWL